MLGKHNRKNNRGQISVWADARILFSYVFLKQGRLIIRAQTHYAKLKFKELFCFTPPPQGPI